MWGSDYPHHDATFPGAVDTLRRTMAPLDAGVAGQDPRRQRRRALRAAPTASIGCTSGVRRRHPRGGGALRRHRAYVTPDGSELSYAALDRLSDEVGGRPERPGCGRRRRRRPAPALGAGLRRRVRRRGQDRRRHGRSERPAVAARAPALPGRGPAPTRGDVEGARPRHRRRRGGRGRRRRRGGPAPARHRLDARRDGRRRAPSCGRGTELRRPWTRRRSAPGGPGPARGRGVHVGDHGGAQGGGVHVAPARGHRRHRRRRAMGRRGPGAVVDLLRPSRLHDQDAPGAARRRDDVHHGPVVGRRRPRDGRASPHHHARGHPHPGGAHAPPRPLRLHRHEQRAHDRHGGWALHRRARARGTGALRRARGRPLHLHRGGGGGRDGPRRSPRGRRGDAWAGPARASS